MKTFIYFILGIAFILTSCSQSIEDKANALIENQIKTCLYVPDSYESVATQIDSAFTPYCDPIFHKKLLKFKKINDEIEKCDNDIESEDIEISSAKSSMALWSMDNSVVSRHEYKEAKNKFEKHTKIKNELKDERTNLIEKGQKLYDWIREKITEKPQFIGFQVFHRYRAENNLGQKSLGDVYYIFNPDMTKILISYDTESEDYVSIETYINEFKEEQEE